MWLTKSLLLCLLQTATSFHSSTKKPGSDVAARNLNMKWSFGGEAGTMADLGCVGTEGEYYFHPQKQAKLIVPPEALGKQRVIALFPYNNVLTPGGTDRLNVFEMKHRQLLSDTGDSSFGIAYYNTAIQKVSIVGTLAKVKSQKVFEDGRVYVLIEGTERFYIEEIISERPYIKARVRMFKDYTESSNMLEKLENVVFDEARCTFKYLEMLFPEQNYSIHAPIMKNRPVTVNKDLRSIQLLDEKREQSRRSKFSFAVMDIIKSEPPVKVALLQEHVTERRLARLKSIVQKGSQFLVTELIEKKNFTPQQIEDIRSQITAQDPVLSNLQPPIPNKAPENFVNNEWVQRPTFFD